MDPLRPLRHHRALAEGLTRRELDRAPWTSPHHGVVAPDHLDRDDPAVRIADALPLLRDGSVLTSWAAAYWQGTVMLDGRDAGGRPLPITLASPDGGQHRHRPDTGVRATRRSMLPGETTSFGDVQVASLTRAVYDAALDAPTLRDTVSTIDMGVTRVVRQARTTLANLHDLVARHHKTRGIARVRRGMALASERSASPWETRARLVAVLDLGLEDVLVNAPVFDLDGTLLGIADLLDPATGFVIESDGAHHREAQNHADDNHREERFERAGLTVSRVTALDHAHRSPLVARLAAAHRDARRVTRRGWTLEKPPWWATWEPGRRWE